MKLSDDCGAVLEPLESRRMLAASPTIEDVTVFTKIAHAHPLNELLHPKIGVREHRPLAETPLMSEMLVADRGRMFLRTDDRELDPDTTIRPWLTENGNQELWDRTYSDWDTAIDAAVAKYKYLPHRPGFGYAERGAIFLVNPESNRAFLSFVISLDDKGSSGTFDVRRSKNRWSETDPSSIRKGLDFTGGGIGIQTRGTLIHAESRSARDELWSRMHLDGMTLRIDGTDNDDEITIEPNTRGDVYVDIGDAQALISMSVSEKIVIAAGAGDDVVTITTGDVPIIVDAGAGDDRVEHAAGPATLEGGEGDDFIYAYHASDGVTINGGPGDDKLYGSKKADFIDGAGGRDYLYGRQGDDLLYGGRHPDTLRGGPGDDMLHGGRSLDMYYGDDGMDLVRVDEDEFFGTPLRFIGIELGELA